MENSSGMTLAKVDSNVVRQAKDYKVGEIVKLIIHSYGGISLYFEESVLNPTDRLVEFEIKSVKSVKKQEFVDA